MALSASGFITLLILIFVGPIYYAIRWQMKKRSGQPDKEDETTNADRDEQDSLGYLLGLLGYAIGIGNVWRFPFMVAKNGGGAFIFAYLVCLFLIAMPLFLAESGFGFQLRKSQVDAFKTIHPRWMGIGMAQTLMIFMVQTYFNMVIGYAVVYVGASVIDPLPWKGEKLGAETYWNEGVLNAFPGELEGLGPIQWELALGLFIVQVLSFGAIAFGTKNLKKVTQVTVYGPCVLLAILLIRSVFLKGAAKGWAFYIGKFDFEALTDYQVWSGAASQILFSLSPGFGTAISMSSIAKPGTDVVKTCTIVALCNSLFSILGGFAVFAILGNIADREGLEMADVIRAGPGLAFVAIADGMSTFGSLENVMSVLFFTMLVGLGLDSSFAWTETIAIVVQDALRNRGIKASKIAITGVICVVLYLLGLLYCTRGGNPLLDVVDHYAGGLFLLIICGAESLVLRFGYGFGRLFDDFAKVAPGNKILRMRPIIIFIMSWIMPLGPLVLAVLSFRDDIEVPYGGYPDWLLTIGWISLGICLALVVCTLFLKGESTLEGREQPVKEVIEETKIGATTEEVEVSC